MVILGRGDRTLMHTHIANSQGRWSGGGHDAEGRTRGRGVVSGGMRGQRHRPEHMRKGFARSSPRQARRAQSGGTEARGRGGVAPLRRYHGDAHAPRLRAELVGLGRGDRVPRAPAGAPAAGRPHRGPRHLRVPARPRPRRRRAGRAPARQVDLGGYGPSAKMAPDSRAARSSCGGWMGAGVGWANGERNPTRIITK